FSHTPWAPPDYFRLLPETLAAAVLRGLLGADRAGFLSRRWAEAFVACCEEVLGAHVSRDDDGSMSVEHEGHRTWVDVHPLGVDGAALAERAARPDVEARMAVLRDQ